uniref:PHD-type domain-containing protein n=2 Tax=Clytia hemisphaerica TaxID=252671 RepID=A0A7M5V3M3_9CNID
GYKLGACHAKAGIYEPIMVNDSNQSSPVACSTQKKRRILSESSTSESEASTSDDVLPGGTFGVMGSTLQNTSDKDVETEEKENQGQDKTNENKRKNTSLSEEDTDGYKFCCRVKKDKRYKLSNMVECSGKQCPRNNWCHYGCVGITEAPKQDKWFCPACSQSDQRMSEC